MYHNANYSNEFFVAEVNKNWLVIRALIIFIFFSILIITHDFLWLDLGAENEKQLIYFLIKKTLIFQINTEISFSIGIFS